MRFRRAGCIHCPVSHPLSKRETCSRTLEGVERYLLLLQAHSEWFDARQESQGGLRRYATFRLNVNLTCQT